MFVKENPGRKKKKKDSKQICAHNYSHTTVYFERFSIVLGHFPKAPCAKHLFVTKANFLTLFRMWWRQKDFPTSFSRVSSTNVRTSRQNFLTFSVNPFAALVQNFKTIRRVPLNYALKCNLYLYFFV